MNQSNPTLEGMLKDGCTERFARDYLAVLERERTSGMFDADYLAWAHAHGFCAESACAYGLTEHNLGDYLSDYDYWRLWPLNGWQRIWINDKLTLNALLQDSELGRYLPAYFYYTERGRLVPLAGSGYAEGTDGLLATLRREGTFACKPCNGTEAAGFHHLDYAAGSYSIDGEGSDEAGVLGFVEDHPNYVFTEFIRPEASLAAINPLIHTLRALVLNPTGSDPRLAMTYLRFAPDSGEKGSGANYVAPTSSEVWDFNVHVDVHDGTYGEGKVVYANRVVESPAHPASGVVAEGTVPQWEELLEMLRKISLKVGACEYLGFDACVTDKGPKIMEINSHSGIKYLQLFRPIMTDPVAGPYFADRLDRLERLSDAERLRRNAIVR